MFMVAAALKCECVTSKQEKNKKKSQDHLIKLSDLRFVTATLCKDTRLALASEKIKNKTKVVRLSKKKSLPLELLQLVKEQLLQPQFEISSAAAACCYEILWISQNSGVARTLRARLARCESF